MMDVSSDIKFLDVGGRSWEELASDSSIMHMGHNCNHLPLTSAIAKAMKDAVDAEAWRNYTPPMGFTELRTLFRDHAGLGGAEVLVSQGATEAIYEFMSTVLEPGDQMIVSDPAWPHIANFGRSLAAEVLEIPVYSPEVRFKLTSDSVGRAITKKTKLIAVIDPLNPLGSTYTRQEIVDLCDLAAQAGAYFLHDCTYRDFALGDHYPALNHYERAGVALSLSKVCGFAGLRVGALLVAPSLFGRVLNKQVNRLGANWLAQQGAIAALKDKENWMPSMLETNRAHQKRIVDCLRGESRAKVLNEPTAGNFVAIDVTDLGAEKVVRGVLENGIVVRSGEYTSKQFGTRFVRVTTTVPSEYVDRFCDVFPAVVHRLAQRPVSASR